MKKELPRNKINLDLTGFIFLGRSLVFARMHKQVICARGFTNNRVEIKIASGPCDYYKSLHVNSSYWSCARRSLVELTAVIWADCFQMSKLVLLKLSKSEAGLHRRLSTLTGSVIVVFPLLFEQREMESTVARQMASHTLAIPWAHSVTSAMLPLRAQSLWGRIH